MTQDDVRSLISDYLDSHHLAIAAVDGGRAASLARQRGGKVPVSFQKDVPWHWGVARRHEPLNLIVLDMSLPPHQQAAVFLHELGHTDYRERVLRRDWVDAEAELHAQRFAIEQMLARQLTKSLSFLLAQIEKSQRPGKRRPSAMLKRTPG